MRILKLGLDFNNATMTLILLETKVRDTFSKNCRWLTIRYETQINELITMNIWQVSDSKVETMTIIQIQKKWKDEKKKEANNDSWMISIS